MPLVQDTSRTWNRTVTPIWGVTSGIDDVIRQLDLAHVDLLPNLRLGHTLVLASDYSGQHKAATHEVFAFILANLDGCGLWNQRRIAVRKHFFRDNRRMSYKALNDGQRRRALMPFLSAADCIPGLLASVIVNKHVIQSLDFSDEERNEIPQSMVNWPIQTIHKLVFVSHLGSLFVAGLAGRGQDLIWLTDNDDFVANDQRVIALTPFFAGMLSNYLGIDMGHFRLGTTRCDNGDLMIEDLASLPDLVSGALCEIPMRGILPRYSQVRLSVRDYLPPKAVRILAWLSNIPQGLRRLTFVVDEGDIAGTVRVRALEFSPDGPRC
jgi:hypothetical protein